MQERDDDVLLEDGARDRGEVGARTPSEQLTFVLAAALLVLFISFALGLWGVLFFPQVVGRPSGRLACIAAFLGLLAFRWRWARPAAAVCAAVAVASLFF